MSFRISGKNLEIGKAMRDRIGSRIDDAVAKYFDGGGYSGRATVNKDGFGFRTECEVHLDSGALLEAEGMDADAYLSADKAAVRIEKQLRRYNRKLKDRSGGQVRRKLKAATGAN